MARVATKKTNKKADPLDDLEREIAEDLESEFDPEDLDGDEAPANEASKPAKALLGQIVSFTNDEGATITGKVIEAGLTDEDTNEFDPDGVTVEDEEAFWDTTHDQCTVHGGKKDSGKKAPAKTSGRKPKAAKSSAKTEDKDGTGARERRMIEVGKVKVSRDKPRDVDKESPRYKRILADIKKRGQRHPIDVESFSKPTLIDGLRRLSIAEDLGWTHIECQEDEKVEDADDRLFHGLMDNEAREEMSWVDIGRTTAKLVNGGKYSQRKIARSLGLSESQLSKMVSAVSKKGLPKKLLSIAENGSVDPGDEKHSNYSMSVFLELPTASKKVQDQVYELMSDGKPCSLQDLRNLKKADKKERQAAGEDVGEDRPSSSSGASSSTYQAVKVGDWIEFKVVQDEVVVKVTLDWPKKTFRGFDPVQEIKEALEVAYGDENKADSIDSDKALGTALSRAKKELA